MWHAVASLNVHATFLSCELKPLLRVGRHGQTMVFTIFSYITAELWDYEEDTSMLSDFYTDSVHRGWPGPVGKKNPTCYVSDRQITVSAVFKISEGGPLIKKCTDESRRMCKQSLLMDSIMLKLNKRITKKIQHCYTSVLNIKCYEENTLSFFLSA